MGVITLWILLGALSLIFFLICCINQTRPVEVRFSDPDICKKIIECQGIYDDSNSIPPQEARALPNRRLALVFAMDNAFTTLDENYYREFRRRAASKIKIDPAKWASVADIARTLVSKNVIKENHSGFRLMPFVQSLSLKISLHILFGKDPLHLDDKHVLGLAYAINELWEESKSVQSTDKIQPLRDTLQKALLVIFPNQSLKARDTPMNWIIPTYETLWRVVLRLFLEVTFRNPDAAPGWRQTLHSYLEDQNTFRLRANAESVPASFLVDEALRLYPPTRRLNRRFQLGSKSKMITVSADVESCQRRPDIWGQRNLEFLPQRWKTVSEEVRRAFTPFGGRPFMCPAKKVFGPRMIGVLVASMTEYIADANWEISSLENKEDIFREVPLNSNRRAYSSLFVSQRTSCINAKAT